MRRSRELGLSCPATVETVRLPRQFRIPRWHPASRVMPLVMDFHRLNVLVTYRLLERDEAAPALGAPGRRRS